MFGFDRLGLLCSAFPSVYRKLPLISLWVIIIIIQVLGALINGWDYMRGGCMTGKGKRFEASKLYWSNSSSMYCFSWLYINQASNRYNKSNSFKHIWNKARGGLIIVCIFALLVNGPPKRGAIELSIDTFVAWEMQANFLPTHQPTRLPTHLPTYLPTNHIQTHLHCLSPVITG